MTTILEDAQALVNGDRKVDYGDMKDCFEMIAGLWSSYLDKHISTADVAQMMILLKVARGRGKYSYSSNVDIAGYSYCADLLNRESAPE